MTNVEVKGNLDFKGVSKLISPIIYDYTDASIPIELNNTIGGLWFNSNYKTFFTNRSNVATPLALFTDINQLDTTLNNFPIVLDNSSLRVYNSIGFLKIDSTGLTSKNTIDFLDINPIVLDTVELTDNPGKIPTSSVVKAYLDNIAQSITTGLLTLTDVHIYGDFVVDSNPFSIITPNQVLAFSEDSFIIKSENNITLISNEIKYANSETSPSRLNITQDIAAFRIFSDFPIFFGTENSPVIGLFLNTLFVPSSGLTIKTITDNSLMYFDNEYITINTHVKLGNNVDIGTQEMPLDIVYALLFNGSIGLKDQTNEVCTISHIARNTLVTDINGVSNLIIADVHAIKNYVDSLLTLATENNNGFIPQLPSLYKDRKILNGYNTWVDAAFYKSGTTIQNTDSTLILFSALSEINGYVGSIGNQYTFRAQTGEGFKLGKNSLYYVAHAMLPYSEKLTSEYIFSCNGSMYATNVGTQNVLYGNYVICTDTDYGFKLMSIVNNSTTINDIKTTGTEVLINMTIKDPSDNYRDIYIQGYELEP